MEEQTKIDELGQIEKLIFDKPFTAERIKEMLNRIVLDEQLSRTQHKMSLLAPTIYKAQKPIFSLSQKKNDYEKHFNEIINRITSIKITSQGKSELLERCEKCENEISRIRNIIRSF